MKHHQRIRLAGLLTACILPLAAPQARAADPAGQPSAQDIRNRLLGHDATPGASAAPSQPAGGAPDCSTQAALESNPACFNQVSGADRGFSIMGPRSSGASGAAAAPPPRTTATGHAPVRQATAGGRRPVGGAASTCGLADTSNAHGVNLCITFALNSSVLTPTARGRLDRLFEALSAPELKTRGIRIEGYADISGNAQANQALSEARARSVADYLVGKGLARTQVEAQGFGSTHLLPGRDPTDPANRRVEARLKD